MPRKVRFRDSAPRGSRRGGTGRVWGLDSPLIQARLRVVREGLCAASDASEMGMCQGEISRVRVMDFLGVKKGCLTMPFYLLDFTVQKAKVALRCVWGWYASTCSRSVENRGPRSLGFFGGDLGGAAWDPVVREHGYVVGTGSDGYQDRTDLHP